MGQETRSKADLRSLNGDLVRRPGRETPLIFLGAGTGIWNVEGDEGSSGEMVGGTKKDPPSSTDLSEESSFIPTFSLERFRKEDDFGRSEREENFSPTKRLRTETLLFLPERVRQLDH